MISGIVTRLPIVKQINDLLWYFHRREERLWPQYQLASWEQERVRGRKRFLWKTAATFGFTMTAGRAVWDYFDKGNFSLFRFLLSAVFFIAGGYLAAVHSWSNNEARYERYRKEQAGPN
jgi:hypothetical protein